MSTLRAKNRTENSFRALKFESLEERRLLSAVPLSAGEYSELMAKYAALELPQTMDELNIITLDLAEGDGLAELRSAIETAGTTESSDLIVVRTTADANTLTYTSSTDTLSISIDSSAYGSLTLLALGDTPLTLDAAQLSRVTTIQENNGDINFGNIAFTNGKTTKAAGGGLYIYSGNSVSMIDCLVTKNQADTANSNSGGGIYNYKSDLTLLRTEVSENNAYKGGGIYSNRGTVTVTDCAITGNTAKDNGGGIYSYSGTLTVTGSEIIGNTAQNTGGGIYSHSGTLTVTGSVIAGNTAQYSGGGIRSSNSTLTVASTTISGNTAKYNGGIDSPADPQLGSGTLTIRNSIITQNFGLNVSSGWIDGGNNWIGYHGSFVSAPIFDENGTLTNADTMDLHLRSDSCAIDAGNNKAVSCETDLDGNLRIFNGTVDIGAYEYQGDRNDEPIFYSSVVNTLNDSFDLTDDEWSLREAIYYASEYVKIKFAEELEGTITLTLGELVVDKALSIDGDSRITIDADLKNRIFYIDAGTEKQSVLLNGLTIQNGYANVNSDNRGGGIYNKGVLTVTNVVITGNSAFLGGGIYNNGVLNVAGTVIRGNSATRGGGIDNNYGTLIVTNSSIMENSGSGIYTGGGYKVTSSGENYNNEAELTLINCTILGNTDKYGGGGISNGGTLTIINCKISGNTTSSNGGGISNSSGILTIVNSVITGNSASSGGGIYSQIYGNSGGMLKAANSTIAGNNAASQGGGLYSSGTSMLYNTIIAENTAKNGTDVYASTALTGSHNLSTYDGWGLETNYLYDSEQPLFKDKENGDYSTVLNPQTIDRGSNELAVKAGMDETWTDLAGNARFQNDSIDIGAYETSRIVLSAPSLSISVLGEGTVFVTLTDVPNAAGYLLEYAADAGFTDAKTVRLDGSQEVSGILEDTEFFFRVKALGVAEYADSQWSAARSLVIRKEAGALIVNTTLDVVDAYDGVTSIREAIAFAKEGETVTFDESMRDQTIVLNGSPLSLTKAVSLDAGDLNVTLDADFESSVLYVNVTAKTPFVLKGLAFTNGAGGLNFSPAGIEHENGLLTVMDCVIAKNDGAGICSSADELTVMDSQITQNEGVGIYFAQGTKLTVISSEIAKNDWDGLYVLTNALTLTNCTVVGNYFNGIYANTNSFVVNNSIVTANLMGWDLYGKANAANSIIGDSDPRQKVSLRSTQKDVWDPGFAYLPEFANYEEWLNAREEDWDLALRWDSKAVDKGDTKLFTKTGLPQTCSDAAGNARVTGKKVDIGAYEYLEVDIETPEIRILRSGKKLTVTWDAVPGASSYLVEYRDVKTAKWTLKNVKKGTSLAINGKVGTTYEIRVAAVTANGNSKAAVENVTVYAPLTTPKLKAVKDLCKDDTFAVEVTNYAANLASAAESVTFGMNGKYETFEIKNETGNVRFSTGETVEFKNGIFTVTNAKANTQYKLEVMFANPLTGSAFAKVNVKTTKTTYLAPTDFRVTASTSNSISLDWSDSPAKTDASKLAQKYTVQYSTNGGKTWRSVSVKTSDATLTRLRSGTYLIRVLAAKDSKFEASLPTEILEIRL